MKRPIIAKITPWNVYPVGQSGWQKWVTKCATDVTDWYLSISAFIERKYQHYIWFEGHIGTKNSSCGLEKLYSGAASDQEPQVWCFGCRWMQKWYGLAFHWPVVPNSPNPKTVSISHYDVSCNNRYTINKTGSRKATINIEMKQFQYLSFIHCEFLQGPDESWV